jgi:hypothetical protein
VKKSTGPDGNRDVFPDSSYIERLLRPGVRPVGRKGTLWERIGGLWLWLHIRFDRYRFGLRRRTEVSALALCAGAWSVSLDVVLIRPDDVSGGLTVDKS